MRTASQSTLRLIALLAGGVLLSGSHSAPAQDWPQWRGPARDAKVAGFSAPTTWPKELIRKWQVTVGQADATPALVGDKVYVFGRKEGREVALCLNAASGKVLWEVGYDALAAAGPAARHPGPRSSPTVSDGKVITYGVRGVLSCLDASDGKVLWRKTDFTAAPRFFTSSSPLVTNDLVVAQLGGEDNGAIIAFALSSGDQKWKWTGDGTAYSSPVVQNLAGTKALLALTAKKVVALNLDDGKLLWEAPFVPPNRAYNAATPIIDGSTFFYSGAGRGTKAVNLVKDADAFVAKDLWSNTNAVQFNTPVLNNGLLYGLAQNGDLFCINTHDGRTAWTEPALAGRSGFGSIVDAGTVLMALTPQSQLIVFQPSDKAFQKLASYKVAETEVYAYPVLSKNGVYIKDQDSLALWTFE
jgi:outer membrane protein assembly factor BamB